MDVLWAPWRMAYIGGPASRGCIFCDALTGDPRERLLLSTTTSSVVMLNRYPYASGHLLVAPRRHTNELPDMNATEYAELGETLRGALALLKQELRPQGMNIGMNL